MRSEAHGYVATDFFFFLLAAVSPRFSWPAVFIRAGAGRSRLLLPSCPAWWCGIGTPYLRRFIPIFAGEVLCQYSSLCHPRLFCSSVSFGFLFVPAARAFAVAGAPGS